MNKQASALGAVFGFISVVTTLGVHLIVIPATTFEESVLLHNNIAYLLSRGWIIFHCLAVFISMGGVFVALNHTNNLNAKLGFMCFAVFSWTEITRMFLSLTYLRSLRQSYVAQADPILKSMLRTNIENFSHVGEGLFGIFILAFALGNLFFAFDFLRMQGFSRIIGYALVVWFFAGMLALAEMFYPITFTSAFFPVFNITFQPLVRGLLAYWLLRQFLISRRDQTVNGLV